MKKLWPLEDSPEDVPHVTVPCANCSTNIFVAKDDLRLPDGPFFCPIHRDVPTITKSPEHTEADLICDRCGSKLTARGTTREDALAQLYAVIVENQWDSAFDGAKQDLCFACSRANASAALLRRVRRIVE